MADLPALLEDIKTPRDGRLYKLMLAFEAGATIALGADDPLLFDSRLLDQYETARSVHGLDDAQLAELARGSFRASRAPREVVETAVREVAEETGIHSRPVLTLGTIDYWFATSDRRIHKFVHHYLLEAIGGYLTIDNDPDHEAVDVAWLPLRDAPRHLTFPNERRIAREAWQRLAGDA